MLLSLTWIFCEISTSNHHQQGVDQWTLVTITPGQTWVCIALFIAIPLLLLLLLLLYRGLGWCFQLLQHVLLREWGILFGRDGHGRACATGCESLHGVGHYMVQLLLGCTEKEQHAMRIKNEN